MSLIKCIECGKEISDKSEKCVNCGCPTSESIKCIEQKIYSDKLMYKCPLCKKEFVTGVFKCDICGYENFATPFQKIIETEAREASLPKCPHCNSTNISKISTTERVGSIAMFGIFSKKINKSFKCKSCGYTW